jgi:hypothetical protein
MPPGTWSRVERIIARVEAGPEGTDTRFIVTNFTAAAPRSAQPKLVAGQYPQVAPPDTRRRAHRAVSLDNAAEAFIVVG